MSVSIDIIRGADADRLFADSSFRAQWAALCARCPWATAFQASPFAMTWYEVYRSRYEPLLVLSRDGSGALSGLLPLAVSSAEDRVGVAGLWQAEYQAWACDADLANTFPPEAIRALRRALPGATLRFQYLPPGTPLGWADGDDVRGTSLLSHHRRPLLRFGDLQHVRASLNKRAN